MCRLSMSNTISINYLYARIDNIDVVCMCVCDIDHSFIHSIDHWFWFGDWDRFRDMFNRDEFHHWIIGLAWLTDWLAHSSIHMTIDRLTLIGRVCLLCLTSNIIHRWLLLAYWQFERDSIEIYTNTGFHSVNMIHLLWSFGAWRAKIFNTN